MTRNQLTSFLTRAFDAVERWMLASGLLDQLAFLVVKTTLLRQVVLWAASTVFGAAAIEGQLAQAFIAAAVVVATGSVGMFIDHVRRKYSKAGQVAAGVPQVDEFIGPESVAHIAALAARC